MRWVIISVACGLCILIFILSGYFPEILEPYPKLNRLNCQIRYKMGLSVPDPSYLPDQALMEAEKLLQEDAKVAENVKACGPRPTNPWTEKGNPTNQMIDDYFKNKEAWDRCTERARLTSLRRLTTKGKSSADPEFQLREYKENNSP